MKFECEKTLLASAIDGVSRAITNRAAIPVLEGIYICLLYTSDAADEL